MQYSEFLKTKKIKYKPNGFNVDLESINNVLFDWQKTITQWAIKRGRAALFEDCGLGKTFQQLEWSRHICDKTKGSVLILAPLAVSAQTKREGLKINIEVNVCATQEDVVPGINITNYEKLGHFDPSFFAGVVLDESSILKSFTGKIRNQIIEYFLNTPYKLACTATPSPNDFTELGNTAEFLGIMTRSEMLAMFFVNDTGNTGTWRLKGHVSNNVFWEWLSSWAIVIRKPSDIGFSDDGFDLPPLEIHNHVVPYLGDNNGLLFVDEAKTLKERRDARKESISGRIEIAANLAGDGNRWIMWCNYNYESDLLKKSIPGSVEVKGADSNIHKENSMIDFSENKIRHMITKPKIAGFGMNFQNCNHVAFVGLSDSYEQFYQAIRRCWRFGQTKTVHAHIITGEREGAVVANIKRKEADMDALFAGVLTQMRELTAREISSAKNKKTKYSPNLGMVLPDFILKGDNYESN